MPRWYQWYRVTILLTGPMGLLAIWLGVLSLFQSMWIMGVIAMANIGVVNWIQSRP